MTGDERKYGLLPSGTGSIKASPVHVLSVEGLKPVSDST
jgi:hypothetical protein